MLKEQAYALYPELSHELIDKQFELEEYMLNEGQIKYMNEVENSVSKGNASNTRHGRTIISTSISTLAQAIDDERIIVASGKAWKMSKDWKCIETLNSNTISYIVLKSLIDIITKSSSTLIYTAKLISSALEDEVKFKLYKEMAKDDYKYAMKRIRKATTYQRKRDALNTMIKHKVDGTHGNVADIDFNHAEWTIDEKVNIGVRLINMVVSNLNIVECAFYKAYRASQPQYMIRATKDFQEWCTNHVERSALLSPMRLPTIIPPRNITEIIDTAYFTGDIRKVCIVKTRCQKHKELLHATPSEQLKDVYNVINSASKTAWRVNNKVLEVLRVLWDTKSTINNILPHQDAKENPLCTICAQTVGENHECFLDRPDVFKKWKRDTHFIHEENASNVSKRIRTHSVLWTAELMQKYERMYFPQQLDFRGRLYSVPTHLQPQGDDIAKGLLEFADAETITDQAGANWLAIHTANTWGEDKKPFEERIAWTKENTENILRVVQDPLGMLQWWTKADSPFCFLASCYEWAGYIKDGFNHLSHIPIAQDGTCSGLQHYSAILRDEVGGKAVNLIPSDRPQDIYGVVATRTLNKLHTFTPLDENYPLAQQWLESGLITRKLTKRSVMTLPYGSTPYSSRIFIREHVEEERANGRVLPWDKEETISACNWLSAIVWEQIQSTVIAAGQAMKWLSEVARIVTDSETPLQWTTPTGLPVMQSYKDLSIRSVTTTINGRICITPKQGQVAKRDDIRNRVAIETDTVDTKKQAQGLAPNFIHSMDASLLTITV